MKSILITGYKGMIGSGLYTYLKFLNLYDIHGIDIVDGSGELKTVLDIANEFPNKELKYLPERPGEINKISMDLTKAKNNGLII